MKTSHALNYEITGHKNYKSIIKSLESPAIYNPSDYKLDNKLTGKKVKICIIDSGKPQHEDILVKGESVCFCDNENTTTDYFGHSTIIGGIISGKNIKGVRGLAPNATVSYAKVIDKKGNCNFNSIIAALFWAIVNKNKIIVLSLSSKYDFDILHDAIKKCNTYNPIFFASAGNSTYEQNEQIECPARYDEVCSVAQETINKKYNSILKNKVDFLLPRKKVISTYIKKQYVSTYGSSVSTAILAGLAALIVEKNDDNNISYKTIHNELKTLLN